MLKRRLRLRMMYRSRLEPICTIEPLIPVAPSPLLRGPLEGGCGGWRAGSVVDGTVLSLDASGVKLEVTRSSSGVEICT